MARERVHAVGSATGLLLVCPAERTVDETWRSAVRRQWCSYSWATHSATTGEEGCIAKSSWSTRGALHSARNKVEFQKTAPWSPKALGNLIQK